MSLSFCRWPFFRWSCFSSSSRSWSCAGGLWRFCPFSTASTCCSSSGASFRGRTTCRACGPVSEQHRCLGRVRGRPLIKDCLAPAGLSVEAGMVSIFGLVYALSFAASPSRFAKPAGAALAVLVAVGLVVGQTVVQAQLGFRHAPGIVGIFLKPVLWAVFCFASWVLCSPRPWGRPHSKQPCTSTSRSIRRAPPTEALSFSHGTAGSLEISIASTTGARPESASPVASSRQHVEDKAQKPLSWIGPIRAAIDDDILMLCVLFPINWAVFAFIVAVVFWHLAYEINTVRKGSTDAKGFCLLPERPLPRECKLRSLHATPGVCSTCHLHMAALNGAQTPLALSTTCWQCSLSGPSSWLLGWESAWPGKRRCGNVQNVCVWTAPSARLENLCCQPFQGDGLPARRPPRRRGAPGGCGHLVARIRSSADQGAGKGRCPWRPGTPGST